MGSIKYFDATKDLKKIKNFGRSTVVIKFKSEKKTGTMTLFSVSQDASVPKKIELLLMDGILTVSVETDNNSFNVKSRDKYTDGQWYIAIITLSESQVVLYVDGIKIDRSTINIIGVSFKFIPNLKFMNIGRSINEEGLGEKFFIGEIAYVDIFNRVLTSDEVAVLGKQQINIKYEIPLLDFSKIKNKQIVIDREPNVYLGQPATVLLNDEKTMYAVYPKGDKKGALVLKKSEDGGITWSNRLKTPVTWTFNKGMPTLYKIIKPDGKTRIELITGFSEGEVEGVFQNQGGFKTAYSDDLGETWSELVDWFATNKYMGTMAHTSLTRLKKEDGSWDDRWMGIFTDSSYNNWKTILTFNTYGEEMWSEPVRLLEPYNKTEKLDKLCKIEVLRSPNEKQLALIATSESRENNSMIAFSNDEGESWTEPTELQGALNGERHKAKYDPISGRLFILFKEIIRDPENIGDVNAWRKGGWAAWVGTYDDLVHNKEGQYRILLMKDTKLGDCGYSANEVLKKGIFIVTSYGYWDENFNKPYIITLRLKLNDIDIIHKQMNLPDPLLKEYIVFDKNKEACAVTRLPGIVIAQNGALYACCEGRSTPNELSTINILLKRSDDGGVTWSSTKILATGIKDKKTYHSPIMIKNNNGLMHMLYCENYKKIYHIKSFDNGVTWSQPMAIEESLENFQKEFNWLVISTSSGHGIQLKNGRLIVPIWLALERDKSKSVVATLYSDDNGLTWNNGEIIYGQEEMVNPREATIVQLDNESVMINIKVESNFRKRAIAVSLDGVTGWTTPIFHEDLDDPICFGSMIRLTEGNKYYNSRILFSNINNTDRFSNLTIKMSMDEGKSWNMVKTIYPRTAEYSDLVVSQDKNWIYCLYEKDGYDKLYLAKFNLQWLTEGKQNLNLLEDIEQIIYPIKFNDILMNEIWNSLDEWMVEGNINGASINDSKNLQLNSDNSLSTLLSKNNISIKQHYTLEIKAKFDDFVSGTAGINTTLGIKVSDGLYRLMMDFQENEINVITDDGKWSSVKEIKIDNKWHVWSIVVNMGEGSLYMDNNFLSKFNIEYKKETDSIQLWISGKSKYPAQSQVEYIKLYDNLTFLNSKLDGFFADNNKHYLKEDYNSIINESKNKTLNLTCWRGEKTNVEILLWTENAIVKNVRIYSSFFTDEDKNIILPSNISFKFLEYVKAEAKMIPDMINDVLNVNISPKSIQPVWITIKIPEKTLASIYYGVITAYGDNCSPVSFNVKLEVLDMVLPPVNKRQFHLDLWQNPYALARYYKVNFWSKKHIDYLKSHIKILKEAGQKAIYTTIVNNSWGDTTYDSYGTMVFWTKKTNGKFDFDFTIFNIYVSLCLEIGIDEQINCYGILPYGNNLIYYDETQKREIKESLIPGSSKWNTYWSEFIAELVKNAKNNGWENKIYIAIYEKSASEIKAVMNLVKDTPLKILAAINYINVKDIFDNVENLSINLGKIKDDFQYLLYDRKKDTFKTTCYTTTGDFPNTYTTSNPGEIVWIGWYAAKYNLDGFLKWTWDSWSAKPLQTTDFFRFESGECFLIYPNGKSSVRLERLIEGFQDHEKIKYILDNNGNWSFEIYKILKELEGSYKDKSINYGEEVVKAREKLNEVVRSIIKEKI
ncbi:glycoside hydrolase domain-containing protein [Clostridium tarantellae]|uniref:exo-alpha-sialidase n=1 Tax=Clostridium tarantellae TaxID=39493 RepID=A0A6I1MRY7_9CLOT|nr:glycoside hydrolase domain-containing protein [Clostridium tarantellae]MPQ43651.1 DUF4091 domain-containing protein [Clostridium tarantellae]